MTFNCPHCHQPIEIHPGVQPPPQSTWVTLRNTPVSLGCGSLLAIAIIVAVCSGSSTQGVNRIRGDIQDLEGKIENLEQMIRELQPDDAVAAAIEEDTANQ